MRFLILLFMALLVASPARAQFNNPAPGASNFPAIVQSLVNINAGCGNTALGPGGQMVQVNSALAETRAVTTYPDTLLTTDCGGLVVFRSATSQTENMALAGSTGFAQNWYTTYCNAAAGAITLQPASGTIGKNASFVLGTGTESQRTCIGIYSGTYTGAAGAFVASDWGLISAAGASISGVSNSDGTLTISPTTGAVVASLALGHANTWTAAQTFTNSDFKLLGSSTGATTFTSANAGASNYTLTVPAATDTIATLGGTQSFTGAKTFSEVLGTVTTQTTTYTFTVADCGTDVRFTNSGAITATIDTTLPVGCHINVIQRGAGKVSVNGTAVSACTLTSAHSYTGTNGTAGSVIGIIMDAANTCILTGDGS